MDKLLRMALKDGITGIPFIKCEEKNNNLFKKFIRIKIDARMGPPYNETAITRLKYF